MLMMLKKIYFADKSVIRNDFEQNLCLDSKTAKNSSYKDNLRNFQL